MKKDILIVVAFYVVMFCFLGAYGNHPLVLLLTAAGFIHATIHSAINSSKTVAVVPAPDRQSDTPEKTSQG